MNWLLTFAVGGILCVIAQILMDKTALTPARIVVIYVVAGLILTAAGVYEPLVKLAGAGATVPLTGFGYCLATGVQQAVDSKGLLGAFTGGLGATAGGVAGALLFGWLCALLFRPKGK